MRRLTAWLTAVVVMVTLGRPAPKSQERGEPELPERVLVVLIDAVRPDHLGAYGYQLATSPNFDRLAAAGVLFEECRSTSTWTKPALASLFSGFGPMVHRVEKGGLSDSRARLVPALSDHFETLAEVFRRHGYTTVAFTGNPHVAEATGLVQGFDRVVPTNQFGPGLAKDFIAWLETPMTPSQAIVGRLSSDEHNMLRGWPNRQSESAGGLGAGTTSDGFRLAGDPTMTGRVCRSTPLAEVPAGDGGLVFGTSYAMGPGADLNLRSQAGRLLRTVHSAAAGGSEGALLERLPADTGQLALEMCLTQPDSFIEVSHVFLVPSRVLDEVRTDRWFAYLHLMNPHLPFRASQSHLDGFSPERYGENPVPLSAEAEASLGRQKIRGTNDLRAYRGHYDASIQEADAMLGQVVAEIERRGLLERTLVVVTADHGEAFLEHGVMNHGSRPYEEQLRVPLLFHYPKGLAKGQRVSGSVSLIDVYPTLLALFAFESGEPLPGRQLNPQLLGLSSESGAGAFVTTHTPMGKAATSRTDVIVRGGFKLMVTRHAGGREEVELYDLREDPGEKENLAGRRGDVVQALAEVLASESAKQEELRKEMQRSPTDGLLEGHTEELLNSLGYL